MTHRTELHSCTNSDFISSGAYQVLSEIRKSGIVFDANGQPRPYSDMMGVESGFFLYDLVRVLKPKIILELGLAFATSTLHMLQAVAFNNSGRVISADPTQGIDFCNAGLELIKKAGLAPLHQFVEERSEYLLPMILRENEKPVFDFIFIDTSHRYDQTMVELYFADRLLAMNGVVVLDDYHMASVRTAANFLESNLYYQVLTQEQLGFAVPTNQRVLKKVTTDKRQWFHFVPFEVVNELHCRESRNPFCD